MYILSTYAYLRTSHYIFRHLENRFALVWVTLSAVCCAGLGWDWGDLIDGDESDSEDSPTFNPEGAAALEAESRNWGCLTRSRWNMLNTFIYVNTPFCWDTFYIILYNQLYNTYIYIYINHFSCWSYCSAVCFSSQSWSACQLVFHVLHSLYLCLIFCPLHVRIHRSGQTVPAACVLAFSHLAWPGHRTPENLLMTSEGHKTSIVCSQKDSDMCSTFVRPCSIFLRMHPRTAHTAWWIHILHILQIPRASCIQGGVWGSMLSKEPKNNHAVETGNLVEDPASRSSTTYRAERGASNAHQPLAQPCCTDLSSPLLCQSYANPLIPHFAVLFAGFPMVSWIFLTFLLFKDAGPPVTQQIQHQFDIFWHPWVQWMSASIVRRGTIKLPQQIQLLWLHWSEVGMSGSYAQQEFVTFKVNQHKSHYKSLK